ncbi:polyketide synthase-nonribosomal peptide synthetase hybrid himA-like [Pecten maximus]|uniref:polyketide synthase-nonribosomal peptide synthetase hybrid himA-like n=1 Tax=Pecten maximus TaxID=6579 RepID=UPI0014580B91|nr:polyketide synthase-nonribosomal peptide synthetase hybrid himA-like [Pecten maximus]
MEELEEIAIVGIGCRLPGANNIREFWDVLVNGENHVKEIPKDRWNLDAIYDPDPDAYGKTNVRRAGLLSEHDVWDNELFGIPEKEASEMDPQQRYVLECVHMALENGGITKAELGGSSTSVYIGAMNSDAKSSKDGDYSLMTNYTVTGDAASIIAARVSYNYNLLGPSLTIDTACSSSLVAINLATQSLIIGESSMAICGGVNSILYPDMFVTLTKARMASPTGQCQAFSANADGYARGEGCGIVIPERLSDALKNDRHIWATIRTGCNQDGQTAKPITAPSEVQQGKLLNDIYHHFYNINPSHVQYIEAHGTGTPIGDPVEVNSLGSFFKDHPTQFGKRLIGSVKTNIGHLESAAGAASLIKTLLMMKHGKIVPSLHSIPRNSKIDFEYYTLDVPASVHAWPLLQDGSRAACINCFGFGGTNSHAFVRQWVQKPIDPTPSIADEDKLTCIPISAKSQNSLINTLKYLVTRLKDEPCNLQELSYTASCKRDHLRYRRMFVESSITGLVKSCNHEIETISINNIKPGKEYRIVYVFCGVGTAWTEMGMAIVREYPVFANTLTHIDTYLMPLTGWSIADKIRDGEDMEDPFISHIGIFACQVGLSNLWKHWRICPDAIVGQSVGEVAAAYCSGVLSLCNAVKVVYHRSKLLAETSGGRMMVIRNIDTTKIAEICRKVGQVDVAVYSSPVACTISGDDIKVEEVKTLVTEDETNTIEIPLFNELNTKFAYHSYKVEQAAIRIKESLEGIETDTSNIPIFSTVTGKMANDFGTPEYWRRNTTKPVLFHQALRESTDGKPTVFLEIGPAPVLKAHLGDIFKDEDVTAVHCLKSKSGSYQVKKCLMDLYAAGINPSWENIIEKNNLIDLPSYQFDGKHLMVESDFRFLRRHGLIDNSSGQYLMLTQKESEGEFKVNFSPNSTPFVYEHVIDDATIIPGAVYTEVAFELGMSRMGIIAENMQIEYEIIKSVPLFKGKPFHLDLLSNITEKNDSLMRVSFSIVMNGTTIVRGSITNKNLVQRHIIPIKEVCIHNGKQIGREDLYSGLAKHGYKYGNMVQVLESVTFGKEEYTGFIELTEDVTRQLHQTSFHPAVLDAMFHSSALDFFPVRTTSSYKIYPIRIGRVSLLRRLEKRMMCYTQVIQKVYDRIITNIILTRLDGLVLAEVQEVEHRIMNGSLTVNDIAYQITWTVESIPEVTINEHYQKEKNVTIFFDDSTVCKMLRSLYPKGDSIKLRDVIDNSESVASWDLEQTDVVIFVPDSFNQRKSSNDLFSRVCKNCDAFLTTMKKMKDVNKPVIIVTENTQGNATETAADKNVIGAELWGFTRSLRQEGTKCRMILIDVQPTIASQLDILYKTVDILTSDSPSSFTEFVIVEGQLHRNILQRRPQNSFHSEKRVLSTDIHLDLQLQSVTSDSIDSPFLTPCDLPCKFGNNEICLRVEEICIHSPTDFRLTELETSVSKSLWSEYRGGYPVIGLEFQGTILTAHRSRRVVACYPSRITNKICVPKQCVCDLSSLPMYSPGLIIRSMLMWAITERIRRKSKICIVTEADPSEDDKVSLLRDMVETVKYSQVRITSICSLRNCRQLEGDVFVLLQTYPQPEIACILQPGNTILCFDDVMTYLSNKRIQLSSKGMNVHIVSKTKVFEENNVVTTFPKVISWLQRRRKSHDLSINVMKSLQLQTINLLDTKCGDIMDVNIKAMGDNIFRKNATYVVVGGLTGLGWDIVKWLGHKGAGVVVPLSRRGANPQMEDKLRNAMDMHKYKIVPMICNVANEVDVKRTFSAIKLQFSKHPVKGIFQGAGVLRDTRIENMTMEKFKEVMEPKVLGTWNLHLMSKELVLDFFVMHSSTTSIFGNAGQTNYGAANSFMDSLALYRRSINLPGTTINWGALAVGMATDETIRNNLEAHGYYVLETDKIRECLIDSLNLDPCQVIYGLFDWSMVAKNPATVPTSIIDKEDSAVINQSSFRRREINTVLNIAELKTTSYEDQRKTLAYLLLCCCSKVLSIDTSDLEEKQNLLGLGMESQKSVELIQIVHEATGYRLPVAYILSPDYTIGMVIDFLHSQIINNTGDKDESSEMKEDVLGSPTWMQKFYIDTHETYPLDSSLWFSIDFKLGSGLSNIDLWRTILRWITIRNQELRTVYRPTNERIRFGIKRHILDPEDAKVDLRVVDTCVIKRDWTDRDVTNYCTFDITTDPPMRVLYGNTGKEHDIRFIMSHITFDLQSFFALVSQLHSDISTYLKKKDVILKPTYTQDMTSLIEERLDDEMFYLQEFWKGELNTIRNEPALVGSETTARVSGKTEKISIRLPRELVDKINNNDNDVTGPTLLFCFYQILLHKMTSVSTTPVVLTVDMRRHFPELTNRIFLGTNYIPIITVFKDAHATLGECIKMCSRQMALASTNSLYPFLLITQNNSDVSSAFRHFFNVRYVSQQTFRNAHHQNYYMENTGYNTGFLNHIETALNIVTDTETGSIDFVLSYDSAIVSLATANNMLDDLLLLACVNAVNSDIQLGNIPLQCCHSNASDGMDQLLQTVRFLKESSNGWQHPVQLRVTIQNNVPQLAWDRIDSKAGSPKRTISIPHVLAVEMGNLHEFWVLIIQTIKRQYFFKTDDYIMALLWKARIRILISRQKLM